MDKISVFDLIGNSVVTCPHCKWSSLLSHDNLSSYPDYINTYCDCNAISIDKGSSRFGKQYTASAHRNHYIYFRVYFTHNGANGILPRTKEDLEHKHIRNRDIQRMIIKPFSTDWENRVIHRVVLKTKITEFNFIEMHKPFFRDGSSIYRKVATIIDENTLSDDWNLTGDSWDYGKFT